MQKGSPKMDRIQTARNILPVLILPYICHAGFAQELTIKNSIPVPDGCVRESGLIGSFCYWIQNLPLKDTPVIHDYRGKIVRSTFYNVWGVVQMPLLFRSDLEQCTDFAMRFWAEYHKSFGMLDRLYLFDYNGNKKMFRTSGETFDQFLKSTFSKANSHSLKQGSKAITGDDAIPGDLIVQNEQGGVGHVSVIMDVCRSVQGRKLFLIGYSFMPAQEFHIERANETYGTGGWFTLEGYYRYLADHLDFGKPVLRRFDPL
jgi:hypothetical protein